MTSILYNKSQKTETELVKLEIIGEVPSWISGKLVRNGPAIFELGKTNFKHWFDGF